MEKKNKAPPLWDGNKEPPRKGLRPPNTLSGRLLVEESRTFASAVDTSAHSNSLRSLNNSLNDSNVSIRSNLSVDAPEFYPAGYSNIASPATSQQSQQPSSIQNRLKKHRVSSTEQPNEALFHNEDEYFIGSADDNRLQHLIRTLTKDPGQFSDLLEIFIDTLSPYFTDIFVLSRAAKLLVEQAIDHHSFRYSAARLCCVIEQYCAEFRAALHLTCQMQLENHSNTAGLLLFVAELYAQLHHENIYGKYLIDAFKHLLNIGGNENVKSICQSLKLTGYSLELYDKKALDEVFVKLNQVKPTVTGTALSLINSVVNLRSSRWGHDSPVNERSTPTEADTNTYWNETPHTEFLSVDGPQLTAEENDFLAANMISTEEYFTDLSDPDELYDPEPEMDEEIQAAFKDFVKGSKR